MTMKKLINTIMFFTCFTLTCYSQNEIKTNHDKQQSESQDSLICIEVKQMNILFVGIENPLRIFVSGVKNISVKIDNGTIFNVGGQKYEAKPEKLGNAFISIYQVTEGGNLVFIGKEGFRVKTLPKDGF